MKTEEPIVDLSLYKQLGITVVTDEQVKKRKAYNCKEKWPENDLFDPKGVTWEEARAAMKICKA